VGETKKLRIPMFDMILCLSNAIDLVSPAVVDHHKRVAYISSALSSELGFSRKDRADILMAGALHDIGALSLEERIDTFAFEMKSPFVHGEAGYLLLKSFQPFSEAATLIRYHHVPWNRGKGSTFRGNPVPIGSHILHLADRIDVLTDRRNGILGRAKGISEKIEKESGRLFMPELVDAFLISAGKESFWLDIVFPSIDQVLARNARAETINLDMEGLLDLARLFSRIIDFRSRFTAVHSSGVAATAGALAGFCGFSEQHCQMMKIAGYLHDLGKLAVPAEILDSPQKLGEEDFRIVKGHTFYTRRILETIGDLDVVTAWASLHHERLEGRGYPFHYKATELSLGSRIMSVADVFTAVTEDRPYRKRMTREEAFKALDEMAQAASLDPSIVSLLKQHYEEIGAIRAAAQAAARKEYETCSSARASLEENADQVPRNRI
jgi:HD-GYP domain-containing protein (c-di-GMP phosphodiesterase class II)